LNAKVLNGAKVNESLNQEMVEATYSGGEHEMADPRIPGAGRPVDLHSTWLVWIRPITRLAAQRLSRHLIHRMLI